MGFRVRVEVQGLEVTRGRLLQFVFAGHPKRGLRAGVEG